jgi:hypothetical protein
MHQFLAMVTCVGSTREIRLEAINKEFVSTRRAEYMRDKIGSDI